MHLNTDLPRESSALAARISQSFPVLLITGARQVGKTTLLRNMLNQDRANSRTYVSLDDPLVKLLAQDDPALFFQRYPPPILLDEVQYAPQLFAQIKLLVDINRKPGQFWLTGSQPFSLMQGVSESLAGRVGILRLCGFSQNEAAGFGARPRLSFLPTDEVIQLWQHRQLTTMRTAKDLFDDIWRGSFPGLRANASMDRDVFFNSYLQTYVQRDIRAIAKVVDELAFTRFVIAAAARTGQLLNIANLARDVGISPKTAQHWLSLLQTSGLIYLLQPWHENTTSRLIKTPKLYFLDTGFASWLTRWTSSETLQLGAMSGATFETWVVTELLKSYWHLGKEAPFYFYRDKDQVEVDLLIEQDGKLFPIDCKQTASPRISDLKRPKALTSLNRLNQGAVICLCADNIPLNQQVTAVSALRW